MRKSLLALALTAAFPAAALAQMQTNGIEIYGVVDIGYEHVDVGARSANRISSGISTGSRWGIRGREDLGGGYAALFTLESRVELDTGQTSNNGAIYWCGTATLGTTTVPSCPGVTLTSPLPPTVAPSVLAFNNSLNEQLLRSVTTVNAINALFDRQAWAGMVTPFGAIIAGRQYTPGYETFVKFNSFADGFAGNPGQFATINLRANNSVQYRAELKGFTLAAMYGFGGSEASAVGPNNRTERGQNPNPAANSVTQGDDFWGFELQYQTERFGLAGAYQQNRTVTYSSPTQNQKGLETYNFGAWVAFGDFKVFGHYLKSTNDNPVLSPADIQNIIISTGGNLAAATSILSPLYINRWDVNALRGVAGPTDASVYHLGLEWLLGSGRLIAAYNYGKDTSRSPWATADASLSSYGLAYYHYLSKRTWLYGAGALASNSDQSRVALGGAGYVGGWTTGFGEDAWSFQLGMRHMF